MILVHEQLISRLNNRQLQRLHMVCCRFRGRDWPTDDICTDDILLGIRPSNEVYRHPYGWLVAYHWVVLTEMELRGFCPDPRWRDVCFRGAGKVPVGQNGYGEAAYETDACYSRVGECSRRGVTVYPEHDAQWLQECCERMGIDVR